MDVPLLRALLMEIGHEQFNLVNAERRIVTSKKLVWTLFPNVVDVIGVFHIADITKSNNLASGAHDTKTITIDGSANPGDEVMCDYVVSEGLNDATAQTVIDWAKFEVIGELNDSNIDIVNGTTDTEQLGRVYWQMLSIVNAYFLLNNVNFIMSDANMSLFNFQTMSKLWGEGMSTDALFMHLMKKIEKIQRTLMMMTTDSEVFSDVDTTPFWKDDNMFKDWLVQDLSGKSAQFTVSIQ